MAKRDKTTADMADDKVESTGARPEPVGEDAVQDRPAQQAPARTPSATVTVCCCLPHPLAVTLPDGRELVFAGVPVSRLTDSDGTPLRGKYGKTRHVRRVDWDWFRQAYAECRFFQCDPPLLFAEADDASAQDRAREQADPWHEHGGSTPEAASPAAARGRGQ